MTEPFKILKLIFVFYIFVVLVGIAQIWWGPFIVENYLKDPLELFYVAIRLFLSLLIIAYWLRGKIKELFWVLLFENITNLYINLYVIFIVFKGILEMNFSLEYIQFLVHYAGVIFLLDIFIFTVSLLILVFLIKNWSFLLEHNKRMNQTGITCGVSR